MSNENFFRCFPNIPLGPSMFAGALTPVNAVTGGSGLPSAFASSYFLTSNSDNWKTRSRVTAATPVPITVTIWIVNLLITVLFFVVRHTIGRFTAALAKDVSTVALPARDALIFPCIAIVAAAAVVLALLTRPPKTPVANMP